MGTPSRARLGMAVASGGEGRFDTIRDMRFSLAWGLIFALPALAAQPNTLTSAERTAGWRLLFDGRSFAGWRTPEGGPGGGDSWKIADGCLEAARDPHILEDLTTTEEYRNFEFAFDYRLEPGGNSGIKYHVWNTILFVNDEPGWDKGKRVDKLDLKPGQRGQAYTVALEFQLADDERHPDALRGPDRRTGALYALLPPQPPAHAEAGQWHSGKLVVHGSRVEHWVDDVRVLAVDLKSPDVKEKIQKRWARQWEQYTSHFGKPSPVVLQNHGDSVVWFRNLKIRTQP